MMKPTIPMPAQPHPEIDPIMPVSYLGSVMVQAYRSVGQLVEALVAVTGLVWRCEAGRSVRLPLSQFNPRSGGGLGDTV